MDYSRWKLRPERQQQFLQCLKVTGLNVSAACRRARIARSAVYAQRSIDDDFAMEWRQVEDEVLDELEAQQYQAAKSGGKDRRWVLARRSSLRSCMPMPVAEASSPA